MEELLNRQVSRDDLLRLLKEGQAKYGYLPYEFMDGVARALGLPVNEVYGMASFYSFLSLKPVGRNVIKVCKCLPCHIKGGPALLAALQAELGIGIGETTEDGRFTLHLTNCIGACDEAPALMVNGSRHGRVEPERIREILASYA